MENYNSWDYADINMKVETQTQGAELKARKWTLNIVIKFIFDKSACDSLWRDSCLFSTGQLEIYIQENEFGPLLHM